MPFHRLTVPSYFGGLPGGYDYVNNAIIGTPSFADSAKIGGPNAGTYFIAFGEDATSADANRPAKALAENTDFLDNLLRRDIAVPVRTSDGVGAPTASVVLTGPGVFMGLVGAVLKDLFHVTSDTDEDLEPGGVPIVIASAVDMGGTPVPVGGGFSDGNVTITFNIPIPAAQGYHVYYAIRSNFATFPADGLTNTRIRNLTEVDAAIEELFRLLHGNSEAWNAAWDSTVWDLTARGMDGAYRRSTTGVAGTFNVAGSGAVIVRDGVAPTERGQQATRDYVARYQELHHTQAVEIGADRATAPFGSGGYLFSGQKWLIEGTTPATHPTPSIYSFASIFERNEPVSPGAPGAGTGYATEISPSTVAAITQLSPTIFQVVLSSGFFFRSFGPNKETAVSLGRDMLRCNIPGVGDVALVITALDTGDVTGKTAHCTTLDGGQLPGLPVGPTTIQLTWVSLRMQMGEGASSSKESLSGPPLGTEAWDDDMFFCAPIHPGLTRDVTDVAGPWQQYINKTNAYFGALIDYVTAPYPVGVKGVALGWGTLQMDVTLADFGRWQTLGKLLADGSFVVPSGSVTGALTVNSLFSTSVTNSGLISSTDVIATTKVQGGYWVSDSVQAFISSTGNPHSIDFTDGAGDPYFDAPRWDVQERRFFDAGADVTINSIKLPLNATIGQRFYLLLSETDRAGTLTGGLIACVNRSGVSGGNTWRISLFNNFTNTLSGVFNNHREWEFECIYAGTGTTFDKQTTYIVREYNAYTGVSNAFVNPGP